MSALRHSCQMQTSQAGTHTPGAVHPPPAAMCGPGAAQRWCRTRHRTRFETHRGIRRCASGLPGPRRWPPAWGWWKVGGLGVGQRMGGGWRRVRTPEVSQCTPLGQLRQHTLLCSAELQQAAKLSAAEDQPAERPPGPHESPHLCASASRSSMCSCKRSWNSFRLCQYCSSCPLSSAARPSTDASSA